MLIVLNETKNPCLTHSGFLTTSGRAAQSKLKAQVHVLNATFCLFAGRQDIPVFSAKIHVDGRVDNNSSRVTRFANRAYIW